MAEHLRNCPTCGGEGRKLVGHPNDPDPRDEGPCGGCDGDGQIRITTWTDPDVPSEFLWCATDYYPGGHVGQGATEEAAIADLMENY